MIPLRNVRCEDDRRKQGTMGLNCILKKRKRTDWFEQNLFRENIYTREIKQSILYEISEENLTNTLLRANSPGGSF